MAGVRDSGTTHEVLAALSSGAKSESDTPMSPWVASKATAQRPKWEALQEIPSV